MAEILTVLSAVLPVFLITFLGYQFRRINWLTRDADDSLMKVAMNVLLPCLAFSKISGNEAIRQPENVWLPPVIGFFSIAIGMASGGRRQVELRRGRARVRGGGAHHEHEEVGVAPRHERDAPRTTQSVGGPRRASPLHVDDLDPVSLSGCRSCRDVDGTRSDQDGRDASGLRGSSKAGLEVRRARLQKIARARTPSRERQPLCWACSRAHRLAAHFLLHCGLLGARRACSG